MEIIKIFINSFINLYKSNPGLVISAFVVGVLALLSDLYYPKFRGFMGEFWVKLELSKLPKDSYIVLNDIMIKDDNGTHQIDHLVLSKFGIFVIEMKNYYGLIKGKEFDNKWCQYLGKNKSYFINPIHQNYGHIKALSNLLRIDEKNFISIVCFSNQAKLAVNCNTVVTQLDYLKSKIVSFNDLLINEDINKLSNKVLLNNIEDRNLRKRHVRDIRTKISNENELAQNMICPRCGSKLIERNGRYGKFIGCSGYPKCKYIKRQ